MHSFKLLDEVEKDDLKLTMTVHEWAGECVTNLDGLLISV